jgi:NDP-hexose 4-ketoreductase
MSTTSEIPSGLVGSAWPFGRALSPYHVPALTEARARILVLGARGFIGSHVAQLIGSEPDKTEGIFVTRLHAAQPRMPSCGRWACFDVAEGSQWALAQLIERLAPHVVVNCTGANEGSPDDMRELNVGVVHKLVSALASGPPAHLVHLGSAAEYGPSQNSAPVIETARPRPTDKYAATKLEATQLVCDAAESGRISATVLRVFNPIGAGAPASSVVGGAVLAFREAVAAGHKTVAIGGLHGASDFIDVRDVARAVLAASYLRSVPGEQIVFNIGRGIPVSSRWLVHRLAGIARFEGEIVEETPALGSAVVSQWAETTAAHKTLAWRPRYLLSDALTQAWSASSGPRPAGLHLAYTRPSTSRVHTVPLAPEAS